MRKWQCRAPMPNWRQSNLDFQIAKVKPRPKRAKIALPLWHPPSPWQVQGNSLSVRNVQLPEPAVDLMLGVPRNLSTLRNLKNNCDIDPALASCNTQRSSSHAASLL
jgi:hypothetical protein